MKSTPGRDYALRITGGSQLAGDLCVSGSKNAALPEMAAALLTSARLPRPGGDDIGARRVEQHMRGLRQMGARIEETATEIVAEVDRLHGARIVFDLPTVTGTENILLAAVLAEGRTEIFNAAREPHVQDLCLLLGKMGAHIEGIGTERLVVDGVRELGGAEHTVVPDYLEAGTYAIAVAAAGGELRIECSRPEDLNVV